MFPFFSHRHLLAHNLFFIIYQLHSITTLPKKKRFRDNHYKNNSANIRRTAPNCIDFTFLLFVFPLVYLHKGVKPVCKTSVEFLAALPDDETPAYVFLY